MRTSPEMAHVLLHALPFLFVVGLLLGPALTLQSGAVSSPSSPDIISCSSSMPFHFCLSLSLFQLCSPLSPQFCTILPALQACRKRLDHSLSLPAENRPCLIQTDPHVHRVHPVVRDQFYYRSVSNVSNVRILFVQHDDLPGSDNLLH